MQQPAINGKKVLVTGGAGFIGSHLTEALLACGNQVVVLDNFDSFYDPGIKRRNLAGATAYGASLNLVEADLLDASSIEDLFRQNNFDLVVHLAAMAGVRPSILQPSLYVRVNVSGTQSIVDQMVKYCPRARLVFASSSAVYGSRCGETFRESDRADRPLSPYGASKAAGELICHAAHVCYGLKVACLRFFTVFGPRQRPDLAIHKFCRLIDRDESIDLFGDGTSKRDYTYVSDTVDGILAACAFEPLSYEIINLGCSRSITLRDMLGALEQSLDKKANIVERAVQIGDMPYTHANIERARRLLNYEPKVGFHAGIAHFVDWYRHERDLVLAV